jgi:uncharacterized BrkB/YihY/UPF0761 family membrane protein
VSWINALIGVGERFQHRHAAPAVVWGVMQKFNDDNLNLLAVALGWYGFTAIYPLLLVVVTVFGFIGKERLGDQVIETLHKFPIIGEQFTPGPGGTILHGSVGGLIVGLFFLLYGAQGVTQTAQYAMNTVWNVPRAERPGFFPRLGRSVVGLVIISIAFVVNAALAAYATSSGRVFGFRVGVIAGLVVLNSVLYLASFRVLTSSQAPHTALWPGAVVGGAAFTFLITLGTGLVQHQLKDMSATYGAFASIIGTVVFLLLLARLTLYGAELNPVLHHHLYPRALPGMDPTPADRKVLRSLVLEERRRDDQTIDVGYDEGGPDAGGGGSGGVS